MAKQDGKVVGGRISKSGVQGDAGTDAGTPTPFAATFRARLGSRQLDGRGAPPTAWSDFSVPGVPRKKGKP